MNTPIPCDKCAKLYYNCLHKDDPSYMAECKDNHPMGMIECEWYLPAKTERG